MKKIKKINIWRVSMELKHLRREAMIALDELDKLSQSSLSFFSSGLSFCDTLMKITGMIDIMTKPEKNNLNK